MDGEPEKLDPPTIDEKSILEEVENQLLNTLNQLKSGLNVNSEHIGLLESLVNKLATENDAKIHDLTEQLEKVNANLVAVKAQQKADKEAAVNSDAVAACVEQLRSEMNVKFSQTVTTLNQTIASLTTQLSEQKNKIDELEGKLSSVKNATQQQLQEYVKHDELPAQVDLSDYAKRSEIPPIQAPLDLSVFVKHDELPAPVDLSDYAKHSELPNLTDYVKHSELPAPIDLSDYAKRSDIPAQVDLSDYAKRSELPAPVDLSEYAKRSDIPAQVDLSEYAKRSDIPAQVDLSEYAKRSELPAPVDLIGYAKYSDIPAPADLSGYVKLADLGGYAKLTDLMEYAKRSEMDHTCYSVASGPADSSIFSMKIDYSSLPLCEKEAIYPGVKRPETLAQVACWLMETRYILHEVKSRVLH